MRVMVVTAFYVALAGPALAAAVVPGFDSNQLPRNDDDFTAAVSLGFSANFFGTTYTSAFVSNNGYLTFNSGQGAYTPTGLGTGYVGQPIIAPLFADVDTRNPASGVVGLGTGTYNGHLAFGVTYPAVGFYFGHADKLDTFQVILTDRSDLGAGDFDIYFNYDQIQWETGDASGGSDGLGGVSAAVGFNAGQAGDPAGTFFQLPGSLVNGAFLDGGPDSLAASTNDGVIGQFLFQVRDGGITVPPVNSVPEPASIALLGISVAAFAARRRR